LVSIIWNERGGFSGLGSSQGKSATVVKANFDDQTDEHDLKTLFGNYGRVEDVMIWLNSRTGEPEGWGFVEISEKSDGEWVIEKLDGRWWNGRCLRVSKARNQD
jgi:RNA recognition motif-containing protein